MTGSVLKPELVAPDFYSSPEYSETLGPEVVELNTLAGVEPYPEQVMLLNDIFAIDPVDPNKSAAFSAAVVAARQQLKTGLLKQAALGWLFVERVPLIVWSAHEFATALMALSDLAGTIESSPDLSREVASIKTGAVSPSITLRSGSTILFKARTGGGGRGLTGDKVILDEAYALQPMHLGALLPTLIQVPDPQILYASSAGLLKSDTLRGIRDRGRSGSDPKLVYAEWGTDRRPCASEVCNHKPGTDGCAMDDRALWRKSCFVSFRKDPEMPAIENLRRELPPDEFAREVLVWWDDPNGDGSFDLTKWENLGDAVDAPAEVFFAVDVSPGQDWAAIVAAGVVGDRIQVEVTSRDGDVDHRPGVSWLRSRLKQISEAFPAAVFAYQAGGGFESLVPDIESDGVALLSVPRRDVAAACGYFFEQFSSERLSHLGQDDLTDAVKVARKKQIGDSAFVWVREGLTDLAPLYAASLAAWQASAVQDPASNVW